jgi:uncharacterized protein YjcR
MSLLLASFENRVNDLERQLGISDSTTCGDLTDRLDRIEQRFNAGGRPDNLQEIDQMMKELDPGTALTYQQQVSTGPLLYRQQQILACAASLQDNLEQLEKIQGLLLIGQDSLATEQHVVQAPIVNVQTLSDEQKTQLHPILLGAAQLQERLERTTIQLDDILDQYERYVSAVSDKIVQLDAALSKAQQTAKKLEV